MPVTTIDGLIGRIRRPVTFTKMDIEGAEFHAMQKGTKIFKDRSPIVFEFDRDMPRYFNFNADDLVSFMGGFGYTIYDFFGNTFARGRDLLCNGVWNYYAATAGKPTGAKIRQIVSRSLRTLNVQLPPP